MAPKNRGRTAKRSKSAFSRVRKLGDAYQDAVALVAKRIAPSADVQVGQWTNGPDGRRDLDVVIRSNAEGSTPPIVIECKDWNRPIGIGLIDALESKRRDIGASVAMICSNSGFTADAVRKAARAGIPALAVLIDGDKRVRVVVREQIYTPIVEFLYHETMFHHPFLSDELECALTGLNYTKEWTYRDKSLEAWVAAKLLAIAGYATRPRSFLAKFRFRQPMFLDFRGLNILVNGIDIRAAFTVQWMTQVAEVGASVAMYDYLRKVVIFGPGAHAFQLKNVDAVTWGTRVEVENVPPRLLIPLNLRPLPEMPTTMELRMVKNMPPNDPKDAPDIDQFMISEEIVDENQ